MRYNAGMGEHYVYILASKRKGTLYVGMARDLGKRVVRHKSKRANQFAAKYDVKKLVYYEKYKSLEEAVKREKQVKKWRREWKIQMIEKRNPEWQDLFGEVVKTRISGSPVAEPQ
ncbi:MAG: GIY-YIG nuclease family protein [Sedimentisphaerales bacterium]|nr:GIY-YIG nuclease family protein [Sedimentisphaerales bacterium]